MSHATFTLGRFNPPTEIGHGKLVSAVKNHAETTGGSHYVFPTHTQDRKKNPLSHTDKVGAMRKLFPGTNIVSKKGVHTAIDALKHLEKKGHKHVTMVVGDDRVGEFHNLLHKYNGKEYNFKSISVKSAGHRDPDAEGAEGMSASKLRGLVSAGKKDEFVSHYSDKKLGAEIHDKVKKAMTESRKAMFVVGGPGSGKDYIINNILNRFNIVEVQIDQILNGTARDLIESGEWLLVNSGTDMDKITLVKQILEGYEFTHTVVSVTNKVSRERNATRDRPLNEQTRIRKWLEAESASFDNMFTFKNSINLNEAPEKELKEFQLQIENYLRYLMDNGFDMLDEVLEWGTDETVKVYKEATPGQVDIAPKLTLKSLRKRGVRNMPPKSFDTRVAGYSTLQGNGGYSYSGGAFGGLVSHYEPEGEPINEKSAAWQRKEGKSESGGLNKKGVESYRRENPGSKLQTAVTTPPSKLKDGSKAAKRRKAFCKRMKGMKAKLTSKETANDPDSRINKSLRKWNC